MCRYCNSFCGTLDLDLIHRAARPVELHELFDLVPRQVLGHVLGGDLLGLGLINRRRGRRSAALLIPAGSATRPAGAPTHHAAARTVALPRPCPLGHRHSRHDQHQPRHQSHTQHLFHCPILLLVHCFVLQAFDALKGTQPACQASSLDHGMRGRMGNLLNSWRQGFWVRCGAWPRGTRSRPEPRQYPRMARQIRRAVILRTALRRPIYHHRFRAILPLGTRRTIGYPTSDVFPAVRTRTLPVTSPVRCGQAILLPSMTRCSVSRFRLVLSKLRSTAKGGGPWRPTA